MPAALQTSPSTGRRHWRGQAAAVIEEMIADNAPASWDALLDLRGAILRGDDWQEALDLFLACKAAWEADNYLPFYRLRRLLAASLRLETSGLHGSPVNGIPIAEVLRLPHRSLEEVRRAVARQQAAASWPLPGGLPSSRRHPICLRVQEV